MAEIALISDIQGILNRLIPLAKQEYFPARELRNLNRRLETILSLVCDAENYRMTLAMQNWLKSLKDVTSDAENVLGELAYEAHQRKLEVRNRMRNKVRNLFPSKFTFRVTMAHKIMIINLMLDDKAREFSLGRTTQVLGATIEPREFRPTLPFIDDSEVVGRDRDVSVVIGMLLKSCNTHDLSVVSVVGMAGLGKTTLAQLVYKSLEVQNFFEERMWVCVSPDFKVESILNEMVQSLTGDKSDLSHVERIVRKLGEELKYKRFLLVLDDVWNESQYLWEQMWNCLIGIHGGRGSKILVTTRSIEVANIMNRSSSLTHRLERLDFDDCWTLFQKRVFSSGGPLETPNLLKMGGMMVEKCKGVPLAIRSLGGFLHNKKDEWEWNLIEKSEIWRSEGDNNAMIPALTLSFDYLPSPSLKQCFAYCSVFPKDFRIQKNMLIQLWMSVGYLQPPSGRVFEMEDVGDEYFRILVSRGLLQDVELDEYNNITYCKMHDLVHDLALVVSKGNCLILENNKLNDHPGVHHLFLCFGEETWLEISEANAQKLRTLLLTGNLPENIQDFKSIRALEWAQESGIMLPSSISKFIHLTYLDLSKTSIEKLPNFITKFYNLQTLKLPRTLKELPEDFHNLASLRHLCIGDIDNVMKLMPKNVGKLTSLQTLPCFVVGEDAGHKIEELGSLGNLRGRLSIYNLQHVKDEEEAERAMMLKKLYIQELKFHWDENFREFGVNYEGVLEGLKPARDLRCLIIENYGGRRFASWMKDLNSWLLVNLVRFELEYCNTCKEIPPLGHLPHLKVIKMVGLDNLRHIRREFYEEVGEARAVFPALIKFTLMDMPNLEEWSDLPSDKGMFFPCLKELTIMGCPMWRRIPKGLLVQTLVELEIGRCDNLMMVNDPDELFSFASLQKISIRYCPELRCLPKALLVRTLEKLNIQFCDNLTMVSPDTDESWRLEWLDVLGCPRLGSRCVGELLLRSTRLRYLYTDAFTEEVESFLWPSSSYSIYQYPLQYLESLTVSLDYLPDKLQHLTFLRNLSINKSKLKALPEWLGELSSLESMKLWECNNLASLPSLRAMERLTKLQSLEILYCPKLREKCKRESGEEWHKISHIPSIRTYG